MKMMKLVLGLVLVTGLMLFVGCDNEDDGGVTTLDITEITASGTNVETGEPVSNIDLYGATAAENVPLDADIQIVFDDDIEEEDAADHIIVEGGSSSPVISTSVNGNVVTVMFDGELERGTTYTMTVEGGIEGNLGGLLTEDVTVTFSTGGRPEVTPPQEDDMTFYMNFDGELTDETENYGVGFNQVSGYEEDRFGFASSAARFNGNGDVIDIEDSESLLTESITISFWMYVDAADTNKVNHNFAIMGSAAERGFFIEMGGPEDASWIKPPTSHMNSEGNFGTAWSDAINGGGNTNEVVTTAFEGDVSGLFDDQWTHFVITYDASTSIKTVYMDGEIVRQEDFTNQDPMLEGLSFSDEGVEETISKDLAIGYYGSTTNEATDWANFSEDNPGSSNTFSGLLDDVRIWSVPLSEEEVQELYDAES